MPLIGKINGSGKKGVGIPVMAMTLASCDSLGKVVVPSGPATLGEWRAGWVPAKRRKPERNILSGEKWKRMKEGLS